jgi:hypothetical protein
MSQFDPAESVQQAAAGLSPEEFTARRRLLIPALLLIAAGTLGAIHWSMLLIDRAMNFQVIKNQMANQDQTLTPDQITRALTVQITLATLCLVGALLILWAGLNAMVANRRGWVVAGAILALIPVIPWIGAPFGIIGGTWLLYRLRDPQIKAAMEKTQG